MKPRYKVVLIPAGTLPAEPCYAVGSGLTAKVLAENYAREWSGQEPLSRTLRLRPASLPEDCWAVFEDTGPAFNELGEVGP